MKPADMLHRVDTSRLHEDRVTLVAGEVEQITRRRPELDSEAMNNAVFSLRVWALFVAWVLVLAVTLGLAAPWALTLLTMRAGG